MGRAHPLVRERFSNPNWLETDACTGRDCRVSRINPRIAMFPNQILRYHYYPLVVLRILNADNCQLEQLP